MVNTQEKGVNYHFKLLYAIGIVIAVANHACGGDFFIL